LDSCVPCGKTGCFKNSCRPLAMGKTAIGARWGWLYAAGVGAGVAISGGFLS
jgi:hypothetical protein